MLWELAEETQEVLVRKVTFVLVGDIFVSQVEEKSLYHLLNIQVSDVFELDSAQEVGVDPLVGLKFLWVV